MLSTSFVFKRISYQETTEAITKVAWNKNDGWIAFGGDYGLLRILMIEPSDQHDFALYGVAARPSRVSIDKKLAIHEGSAVTTITWNEQKEQITTGDIRGAVVVCGYNQAKWTSELVNESVQSPVVTAVWASDSSKVLLFYYSGYLLLGASTGHKILSMQVRQQEQAKFAFVTDSHYDVFWTGWETKIISYNFDSSERYRTTLPPGDKYVAACLLEFRDQIDTPKIIAITMQGSLIIYNAIEGTIALQQQIPIVATDVQVSPNAQFIAVSGYALENENQYESSAIVRLYRTKDLENIANIKISAKTATSISWDASSLRLAIGTENALYFACLRLSYRHYMLQDGTVVYSSGSSLIKSSQIVQVASSIKKDEVITFWKPSTNSFAQRQPSQFIDQCACGQYMAILTGRNIEKQDGSLKLLSTLTIHSSVGAPVLSLDLVYVPYYLAGCDNYVVTCSPSRISVYDLRFLTGEVRGDSAEIETKLDAGYKYTGIIEWHADSSPFAADRELHVAKPSVSTPITSIAIGNSALFISRANSTIQRYNLPSLQSNVRMQTGQSLKVMRGNCNGTAIAGVTEAGQLVVYYTEDFVQPESYLKVEKLTNTLLVGKPDKKAEEEKPKFDVRSQEKPVDELQKLLGFDGQAPKVERQTKKVTTAAETRYLKQVMQPWDTKISEIWGIQWNSEDPNLLAISTKHKIIILHVNKKTFEDPITSSAHILAFKGLLVNSAYLDESVMYGQPTGQSYKEFETQQLRDLKEAMFGKQEQLDEYEPHPTNLIKVFGNVFNDFSKVRYNANVQAGYQFLLSYQSPHAFLFKIVAESALRELALDVASYCFIRAEDYISYHFTEYIRRIGSDELRKAEVSTFLGDFSTAEHILVKQLGRVDLSIKNEVDLGMWMKILYTWSDSKNNASQVAIVSDELATTAQRQIGLYYLRQRRYSEASNFLSKADDINLYAEALFRAEDYDTLHTMAENLSINENQESIVYVSRILTRIGDVDGAVAALLRLNKAEDAIKVCIQLKRFDRAIQLATEFYLLDVVDKHLSEYLRQLLSSGDDKAALDLLRKTNQGEIAACIIIGAAMEDLKQLIDARQFPIKPGVFNRARRLIALAGKEATLVQRANMEQNLKRGTSSELLTDNQVERTIDQLLNDDQEGPKQDKTDYSAKDALLEDPMFARFGNKAKSTAMIWKLVRQTRYIVIASYMLYIGRPQSALFPALEASGFYQKILSTAGNIYNVVDEEYRYLQKIALPVAIFAALQVEDFDLASQLMEVLESDDSIPSIERDQLEQLAVDVFSRFPPAEPKIVQKDICVQCEKCKGVMPRYSTICSCGHQCQLCSRTGVPIKPGHKIQKCYMCGSLCTVGKYPCAICPMCHEPFGSE